MTRRRGVYCMFKIKNWSSYQSYKDRNPPWIRFHKKTLDDYQFQKMGTEARALLPMLWLLAAEDSDPTSGLIRLNIEEIAYRLRRDHLVIKSATDEIVRAGFMSRVEVGDADLFGVKTTSYETVTPTLQNHHSESESKADTEADTETDDATKRVRDVIGWSEDPSDISRLDSWLTAGCDLEIDILPTIKRVLAKKKGEAPKTLKYFESAIADNYAHRITPMKKGNADAKPDNRTTPKGNKSERALAAALRGLQKDVN